MKKTRKAILKISAVLLTVCLLFGAFPVWSASAATMRSISFEYDKYMGLVREANNKTYGEVGSRVDIYVFPGTGCLIDTVSITDSTGREIEKTHFGYFAGGNMYYITMPNSDIKVTATFKPDTENGWHFVNYNYVGDGSVTFSRNGFNSVFHVAQAGDRIYFSDPVAGEDYVYNYPNGKDCYTTPDGSSYPIKPNTIFDMPDSDITVNIYFDKAYAINTVVSGGTASAFHYGYEFSVTNGAITKASEEIAVTVVAMPDDDHINSAKFRLISESGEAVDHIVESKYGYPCVRFFMPAESVTVYVTLLRDDYDVNCSAVNGTLGYTASEGTGCGKRVELEPVPNEDYGLKEIYYTYTPEVGMDEVKVEIDRENPEFYMPEADVNVKAVFSQLRTAEWLDGDGGLLDLKKYPDGTPLPTTDKIPVKESTWECDYEFSGWSEPAYYTGGLVVFRPIFDKLYTVNISSGTAQPAKAKAGTQIDLTPGEAPYGMYHSGWRVVSGDVEVTDNSFIMPESHVSLYATYAQQKDVYIDFTLSAEKGYVGKPFTVSGTVCEDGEVLDVGGTMTITFSSGAPEAEGAVSYTVPVENGTFTLEVPALTAESDYIWVEYSGYGEYGVALVSDVLRVYGLSAAGLDIVQGGDGVKIYYSAGEELNTDNLLIWMYWMDGTDEEIPVTPDMVSGFNGMKAGWQTLTVACPYPTDAELTFEVYVRGAMLGDANGDGNINVRDVTAIQRHVAEYTLLTDARLLAADVNGDGVVNIDDATALQTFLAEFESDIPVGTIIV